MSPASLALRQDSQATRTDERLVQIVGTYLAPVWRTLRRLGLSESEADDAAQQVMLLASRRLDDIRSGSERAFLMSAAAKIAAGARRKRERRRELVDTELASRLAHGQVDPENLLEQRKARRLLDSLLAELPEELASVLVLFEFEQLPMVEIAEILGLKPGTVASRLRRARAELTRRVNRLEAGHGAPRGQR